MVLWVKRPNMLHSNIEKGKYLNKSFLQQFFDIDATERVSWKWFYWGIRLKKYFDKPDLLILNKVQSLLNQRLDARYFRASSSYSFLWDVPLIAPVIARAALHCMFSFFWQNLSNDLFINCEKPVFMKNIPKLFDNTDSFHGLN